MKLGRIELTHNFEGETGYILLRWYRTDTPLTAQSGLVSGSGLGSQAGTNVTQVYYPAPHSEESLIIEDIDPVMFNVKAYRSADGATPDEEILTLACDASANAQYSTTVYTYIVDRGGDYDPVSGTNELRDERLENAEYTVVERGTGPLIPPTEAEAEYTDRSDDGGGFDFTGDKVFEPQGVYFVIVRNRVSVSDTEPDSGGDEVNNVYFLEEDETFDRDAMNGKLIYADKGDPDSILTLEFENLSLIADCFFRVSTQSGGQRYLTLQLDTGDTVRQDGAAKNAIHLGVAEEMGIMIRSNVMYIISDNTNYWRLGLPFMADKVYNNTLRRDGTLYQQEDYPRAVEYLDSLPPGQVVTEVQWASSVTINGDTKYPYKGFWARDDLNGTFRVPDDRGKTERALLSDSGDTERVTQGPGGFQNAKTSMKGVTIGIRDGSGGSSTGTISGTGFSGQDSYKTTPNGGFITENAGTQYHIRFNNSGDGFSGTDENRNDNTGKIPLVVV